MVALMSVVNGILHCGSTSWLSG